MSDNPKQIEHIPGETRPTLRIWWAAWAMVAFVWFMHFYSGRETDWYQVSLGGFTTLILICWSMDLTGGKVPDSWRRPSRNGKL